MRASLFGLGIASKSPFVTAKQLTNIYVERRPAGEKQILVGFQTPGFNLFAEFGDTPPRGGIEFEKNNVAYIVHLAILWEMNNAGVLVNRGTLATSTGRVSLAHNGVQVMIVDGQFGYIFNTTTNVFTQITAPGFPANATTVAVLSRRFIVSVNESGRFNVSAIDDGLLWDALDFANAESNADPIVSVWSSNGQLILLGLSTTEFWGNSGALDFPFVTLQGTANEWGLAARWSIAKYDNTFACLIKNRMGQVMIARMNGYLPERISTTDIDSIINSYADVNDASAYSYMLGGHPMYVINFPSANASWLYDGSTSQWTKLKSFELERHRSEFAVTLGKLLLVADFENGNVYRLTPTELTDNGEQIEREVIGETIEQPDGEFFPVYNFRLHMEVGIGTASGDGSNPQVSLQVSRDNGKTYGAEMFKPAGAIGEYGTTVEWRRLGTTKSFTPKIRMTDAVPSVFLGASINPQN